MQQTTRNPPRTSRLQLQSYAALLGAARKFSRRKDEAEDLLQCALLIAVENGRTDFTTSENRNWLCGVLKNLAAFDARNACRRSARDTAWHAALEPYASQTGPFSIDDIREFSQRLPPRLRTAALLAISGHTRSEIGWLLRVSDMAVRQYVSEIRRRWQRSGERQRGDILHLTGSLAFGRIRHGLRNHVMASPGVVLASHDPDGYGFSIKLSSQKQP